MDSPVIVESDSGISSLSLPTAAYEDSNAIGETLLHFWTQKLLTDVHFAVLLQGDRILFSAHQLILSMWSPVLAEMLSRDADRKIEDAIEVTDASPSAFEAMLKFMYGSKAELHHQRKDTNFILKVYKLAVKYDVEGLKVLCCEMISNTIPNVGNVFAALEASQFTGSKILEQRCHKILQAETGKVLANHLGDTTLAMMKTVLKLPRVSMSSEYELAVFVFAWAQNKCVSDEQDFKSILFKVVPYLKLISLTADEFSRLIRYHMNWIDEKDGFNIFMNITSPGSRPLPEWCRDSVKVKRDYAYVG